MVYDYGGFPEFTYHVQYPAPGSPELAKEAAKLSALIHETEDWGLDHGAWTILMHLFPDADVPVSVAMRLLDHAEGPDLRLTLVKGADHRFSTPDCLRLVEGAVAEVVARPATGRHHQIRVHLRAIGTPVLGDAHYGGALVTPFAAVPVPRLALHAAALDVPHPVSGRRVVVHAPWPADLAAVTGWLASHGVLEATL